MPVSSPHPLPPHPAVDIQIVGGNNFVLLMFTFERQNVAPSSCLSVIGRDD